MYSKTSSIKELNAIIFKDALFDIDFPDAYVTIPIIIENIKSKWKYFINPFRSEDKV